jgi:hypothetical protein
MAEQQRKGASFSLKDFISGGLLDDVDVTLKNVKFEMFDYEGKSDPAPALGIDLVTGEEAEGEKPIRQHWSCGSADNWAPSEDGMEIIPIGKDTMLRKSSNLHMLFTSMFEAGVPDSILEGGNVSVFEDLKVHIRRKDAPKRGNLPQGGVRRGRDGKEYERDNKIVCVEKIYEPYPWDAKKADPKAGKKAAEKPAASSEGDLDAKGKAVLMKLVADGNGKTSKKEIPTKGFMTIGEIFGDKDPDKNKILGLLFKDVWITANGFTLAANGEITVA